MKKKLIVAICAMSICVQPGAALAKKAKVIQKMPVTAEFQSAEMGWYGRPEPGFVLRWRTTVINGEIAVCGAVAYPNIRLRAESVSVMRTVKIRYQDKIIMRDMSFFARAKRVSQLDKINANCASTGVAAPRGEYTVRLGWDRGSAKG